MPATRIHCHVISVDRDDDWSPHHSAPRDLLPWADPYIASLVHTLQRRHTTDAHRADLASHEERCDPFPFTRAAPRCCAHDACHDVSALDDFSDQEERGEQNDWPSDWHDDVFLPRPLEATLAQCFQPPVYGGFPLLDDSDPTDVADAL